MPGKWPNGFVALPALSASVALQSLMSGFPDVPSPQHALTWHNNFIIIPGLQGQGDREVRLRSPQTGIDSASPTSGRPCAHGELSHAQAGDRPRPPSPHTMHYQMQNMSKDQTRVVHLVQDTIGQMPPIQSHHKPSRWEGEHTPTILGPIRHIAGPAVLGIDFPANHETYPHDCENTACMKISGQYRPGLWVITTQNFDEDDYHICTECVE